MRKIFQSAIAAILICGLSVLTSCSNDDDPVTPPTDEEGGRVARIGNNENFQVEKFESMGAIGATGDPQNAYHCGNTIGTYLKKYGFDIDFAPVADVNTNPENIVIGARAFSDDPEVAAPMVVLSHAAAVARHEVR